jgi:hypothetical protein
VLPVAGVITLLAVGSAVAAVTLTLPGDIVAEAQDAAGADVTYSASASNPAGKAGKVSCDGPGGSSADGTLTVTAHFPFGGTSVTCRAYEDDGTVGATGSFTVTVQDTTPPALSVPGDVSAEATGPAGAVVSYPAASAADRVDGAVPVSCAPASGSQFPLGATSVACTATDSHGNTASASFVVRVVDTTPPVLKIPGGLTVRAASRSGAPSSDAAIAGFLHGATATDIVDTNPTITTDAPAVFPIGTTRVTFTATDDSGNKTSAAASVTVLAPTEAPPPPGGSPPPPGTPPPPASGPGPRPSGDTTPPSNVRLLALKTGDRFVLLNWRLPADPDFDHVEILRSRAEPGSVQRTVYQGRGRQYRDLGLRNRVRYRYVLISFDHSGNHSAGLAAVAEPNAALLFQPLDGAVVKKPPFFVWKRIRSASYYNLQLWSGNTKILSVWPQSNHFQLPPTWTFAGRKFRLVEGRYRWYVWPGMGPRSAGRYGPLLGVNQFTMRPAPGL